ncbi:MAG TPA: class I SAM-dependent methyltransferase [Pseudonocardiaceae bacterium]|nr:class I SAM-dependent methyltransferase [Pseudonocardiaceae bacterium]
MSAPPVSGVPLSVGGFDAALRGRSCVLELAGGERLALPVARWHGPPDTFDDLLLARCRGWTLDVGCGPGRLAGALIHRGVPTLGVDVSPVAVALTRRRGAPAVQADVFDRLPREGRWRHVLLADGNVGIGGDPVALLARVRELLAPGGTAVVELDPPGTGVRRGTAWVAGQRDTFPWARVAVDIAGRVAARAGLTPSVAQGAAGRWYAELVRP